MDDLSVNRWQKYGKDRLYVNLGGPWGEEVAWVDCKTGKFTIKIHEYESAAREAIEEWRRRQPAKPDPPRSSEPKPHPPEPKPPRPPEPKSPRATPRSTIPSLPSLPPLTRDNDLAGNLPGAAVADKVRQIEGERSAFVRWVARRLRLSLGADDWRTGLVGEQVVGESLARLKSRGWQVLHAIQWPSGADIDHLAIGPSGVFTVNAKHHPGARVWVGERMIRVNNRSTDHLRIAAAEAERVSKVLRHWCGWPVPVQPVIAIVGASRIDFAGDHVSAIVADGLHVDEKLASLPVVIPEHRISSAYEAARRKDIWMAAQKRRRSDRQS
ncbi:nuclease-related domain-containing protein [Streptomyces sp. YGL11-2]|uniref:nuclease-related domain-containing protein n=1 Tax=Streptomyces sp. YGL11-2 TaxID=3414028 RepID=UPI003CE98F4E